MIEKRSTLHSNSITAIIDSVQVIAKWVLANNSEKIKLKKKINKVTEDLQSWRHKIKQVASETFSSLTTLHHSITPGPTNNIGNNNEGEAELMEDQSMS